MKQKAFTTYVLWAVFLSLLAVLLPHTAWAFKNWEPAGAQAFIIYGGFTSSDLVSYIAAFVFEAAIATLTHKLSEVINLTPKGKRPWAKFAYRYINSYSFLLVGATSISVLANLAHAVEFGGTLRIFVDWGISSDVYAVAFGGALPIVSLGFANVLSNVTEDEAGPNPEMEQAKITISGLRQQLRESEQQRKGAEDRARIAEDRFGAMGDLVKHLFGEDKRQRILISRKQWPQLPGSAIAVIAESSPAYVSEVLKGIEV